MKKVFKFYKSGYYYESLNSKAKLCFGRLHDLFDLSDNPKFIDVVISTKKIPRSYKAYTKGENVRLTLSNGSEIWVLTSVDTDFVLATLPNNFYVSVIA